MDTRKTEMGGEDLVIDRTTDKRGLTRYQYYLINDVVHYFDGNDFHHIHGLSVLFDLSSSPAVLLGHGSWRTVDRRRLLLEDVCRNRPDINLDLHVVTLKEVTPAVLDDINTCIRFSGCLPKLIEIPRGVNRGEA